MPKHYADANSEIGEMMAGYAARAVELGAQHKVQLDYSEQSLQQLESLLGQLSAGDNLDELCKTYGGYFGEVIRRRFGGEWTIERYPAGDFLIVTLNVAGARLFPSMKIHRRLTQGATENLWDFFLSVRKRLEAQPGKKIQ
jgi:hypothetical protein